jgi:ketosteroid isomerase-like protein
MRLQLKAGLLLTSAALAAVLGACGAPESETNATTEAPTAPAEVATETPELDRGAVGLIRDRYIAAVNDGNLDELMSLWADDGVLLPPDQPAVAGKEAIRAWYQGMLGQFDADAALRPGATHIAGDWGYDRGTYALTLTPKAPAPSTPTTGNPPAELIDPPQTGTQPPAPEGAIPSLGEQAPAARPAGPSTTMNVKYVVIVKRGQGGNWQVAEYMWNFEAPTPARPRAGAAPSAPAPAPAPQP